MIEEVEATYFKYIIYEYVEITVLFFGYSLLTSINITRTKQIKLIKGSYLQGNLLLKSELLPINEYSVNQKNFACNNLVSLSCTNINTFVSNTMFCKYASKEEVEKIIVTKYKTNYNRRACINTNIMKEEESN